MEANHTIENSLSYAQQRSLSDRRWSTICWIAHNVCIVLALVTQVLVAFGLALMLYLPIMFHSKGNQLLLLLSCFSLILTVFDVALSLPYRSRLFAESADTLELALAKYRDGKLSDDTFLKRLDEVVTIRQRQHGR